MVLGLPYARAAVDRDGYHQVCPICGLKCYSKQRGDTKGSGRVYSKHFNEKHPERI